MIQNYFFKILCVVALFLGVTSNAQNYIVAPIPHQSYNAALPVQATIDDSYGVPIVLPFEFNFFGTNYSSFSVGTNGVIKFPAQDTNEFCPYSFDVAIPSDSFPIKNAILGLFHDMDNSNAEGTITYAITGTAPYRKVVISFMNQSHFFCMALKSSFQIIVYEFNSIVDVQIVDKDLCATWNDGNAVVGLINESGLEAYVPPGRNVSPWTAQHEGWRFTPTGVSQHYQYVKCDQAGFDLSIAQTDLWPQDPSSVQFYETMVDAQNGVNAIALNYSPMILPQMIYAPIGGMIKQILLSSVDCALDYDEDTAMNEDEDTNLDGNLANDDADNDGIPNFIDNDDDGDLILTNEEYVFVDRNSQLALLDTDSDGVPNYLDNDDDGDGVLTINEDYNGNHNPGDDDINNNGIPDYLDNTALHTLENSLRNAITVYPNPAQNVLFIDNQSIHAVTLIEVYNFNGSLVQKVAPQQPLEQLDVSSFAPGVYFVKVQLSGQQVNSKFIKM